MGVLTAVPERWHLEDIHSKSVMKHRKNVVPLSPERQDGRGLHFYGRDMVFHMKIEVLTKNN